MKYLIGVCIGVGITAIAGWMGGGLITPAPSTPPPTLNESPQLLDVFRFTLEDEVRKQSAVSEVGYTPDLLLQTFPGLVESDFDTVSASGGAYRVENGSLIFTRRELDLVPEIVGGLDRTGYQQLLQNVTKRLSIDLAADGTLTDVITTIARPR